jgi:hypothetical protein
MNQPGHARLCRGCIHQGADLSHPSPCNRFRWVGERHVKPVLTSDSCSDFEAKEPAEQPVG